MVLAPPGQGKKAAMTHLRDASKRREMTEEYEKLVLSVAGKQQRGKGDAQGPPLKADTFSHLATLHARLLAAPQQPRGWRRLSRA